MPDLTPESIAEAATQPAEASGDQGSAKAVSITEMIEADKYKKAAAAAQTGRSGWAKVRMARAIPPGAV